jgi:hypothetical protein
MNLALNDIRRLLVVAGTPLAFTMKTPTASRVMSDK